MPIDKELKQQLLDKYHDEPNDHYYSYDDVIQAAIEYRYKVKPTILVNESDDDYQGSTVIIAKDDNDMYYYYCYGWGSCSGCDDLQARNGWNDDGGEVWEMVGEYTPIQLKKEDLIPYLEKEKHNERWHEHLIRAAIQKVKGKL